MLPNTRYRLLALEGAVKRLDTLQATVTSLQAAEAHREAASALLNAETRDLIVKLRMAHARAGIGQANGESGDLETINRLRRR